MSLATTGSARRHAGLIPRPGLEARLDEAFGKRLTTVVAGAGFGKSSLLHLWAAELDAVWYEVRPRDDTVAAFGGGLAAALGKRLGPLSTSSEDARDAGRSPGDERAWAEAFGGLVCEALGERLEHDLMLIVDDVHELGHGGAPARLLETLAREAPPTLHLVLASRSEPPFPIERLRGQGAVLQLRAEDLAFTEDEVAELLSAVDDQALDLAAELHAVTGGWPAAVRLAFEAVRSAAPESRHDLLTTFRRPDGELFDYLAAEVFGREPAHVRDLIRIVSPLDTFTAELCEALGVPRASEAVAGLSSRGLLLRAGSGGDGQLELHALVRAFARDRWPLSEHEVREVHTRAAEWLEGEEQLGQALARRVAGDDARALRAFLVRHGNGLLEVGEVRPVLEAAVSLPDVLRDSEIEYLLGVAFLSVAEVDLAIEHLERAAGDAQTLSPRLVDPLGMAVFTRRGPAAAIEIYRRVSLDEPWTDAHVRVVSWWSRVHALAGNLTEAREIADRALEIARATGEAGAFGWAYHAFGLIADLHGDRDEARRWYLEELPLVERRREKLSLANLLSSLAGILFDEGAAGEALAHYERAASLLAPYRDLSAYALMNRGACLAFMGRLDEAVADLTWSADVYRGMRSPRLAGPLTDLGEIHADRGEFALAKAALEEAVVAAETTTEAQYVGPALASLARVATGDDPDRARSLADRATAFGEGPWLGATLLARGWVELQVGDRDAATRTAVEVTTRAKDGRLPVLLAGARELAAALADEPREREWLLEQARAGWHELESPLRVACCELALGRYRSDEPAARRAEQRLRELGVRVDGPHAAGLLAVLPAAARAAVEIRSLGSFYVLRDGQSVPQTAWQSKKARDLLKLLVARRGRPATRDYVVESLWPGEDPHAVSNRLSVAISTVRSVLDPDKRYDPQHFVVADRETIALARAHVPIDVEAFLTEAEPALRNGDADGLAYAASLYAGDFLEDDPYSDWAVVLREHARATYIDVLRALAVETERAGDADTAARYLLRLLERDGFDERAHLALVSTLQRAGRHGDARRHYRTYTARMDEIGIEPSAYPSRPL